MNVASHEASGPDSWSVEWVGPLPSDGEDGLAQPDEVGALSRVHIGLVIAGAVLLGLSLLLW